MTVMIYRNGVVVKQFRRYFNLFVTKEMTEWANEKFPAANKIVVDKGSHSIRIFY